MTGTGLPGNARLVAIAALLLVTLAALAVWAGVASQTQRLREENAVLASDRDRLAGRVATLEAQLAGARRAIIDLEQSTTEVLGAMRDALIATTRARMTALAVAVEIHRSRTGRYPRALDELDPDAEPTEQPPPGAGLDAWGNRIDYRSDGTIAVISSRGADGAAGTGDDLELALPVVR